MKQSIKSFNFGPQLLEDLDDLQMHVGGYISNYSWSEPNKVELVFTNFNRIDYPLIFICPELAGIFNRNIVKVCIYDKYATIVYDGKASLKGIQMCLDEANAEYSGEIIFILESHIEVENKTHVLIKAVI